MTERVMKILEGKFGGERLKCWVCGERIKRASYTSFFNILFKSACLKHAYRASEVWRL